MLHRRGMGALQQRYESVNSTGCNSSRILEQVFVPATCSNLDLVPVKAPGHIH